MDATEQMRQDEEFARRLAGEDDEGGRQRELLDNVAAQIRADEELARRLSEAPEPGRRRELCRARGVGSDAGLVASQAAVAEALRVLEPLRRRRPERAGVLDSIFADLETALATPSEGLQGIQPAASSTSQPVAAALPLPARLVDASQGAPVPVAASAVTLAAGDSGAPASGAGAVPESHARRQEIRQSARARLNAEAAAGAAAWAAAGAAVLAGPGLAASSGSTASSAASSASRPPGSDHPAPAAPAALVGAAAQHQERFAAFQATALARRQEARRRRQERAQQVAAALDVIMASTLASLNGTEAAEAAALPAADMAAVENHTITSVWTGPAEGECVICVEDFVEGDEVRRLPCGHIYHRECVDVWLLRSRACCLCKRPIDLP